MEPRVEHKMLSNTETKEVPGIFIHFQEVKEGCAGLRHFDRGFAMQDMHSVSTVLMHVLNIIRPV